MANQFTPRTRARLDDGEIWGVPVKMHWIDVAGEATPPATLLRAAWKTVADILPDAMAAEDGSEGAAFSILHRGEQGIWLLMDWWAHGDILCQRLARADVDDDWFEPMGDRPLLACVWELEVIEEERKLWIAHMMKDVPDRGAWLRG